jgi:hypothetical protein
MFYAATCAALIALCVCVRARIEQVIQTKKSNLPKPKRPELI